VKSPGPREAADYARLRSKPPVSKGGYIFRYQMNYLLTASLVLLTLVTQLSGGGLSAYIFERCSDRNFMRGAD
jgi:hypothetical protein